MKNFDSRTYSINDFLEWHNNDQLVLSPKYQRRSVWTDNAKSYLMDTIVRGKPIPKIFIRQKLNPQTRLSIREVVDGQQRLRTILSFLKDGFPIAYKHNLEFGGRFFSQLEPETQADILNYEVSVDLLVNMPDHEVLDVFSRLNSYAVVLNEQERINANNFGPFKTLSDNIGHKLNDFWLENRIITEQNVLRMQDVNLVADLLISMIEGIKSKKQIKVFYELYEKNFDHDNIELESQFFHVIDVIKSIFHDNLRNTEFRRIHLFYTLFTAIYNLEFGIPGFNHPSRPLSPSEYARVAALFEKVDSIFQVEDIRSLEKPEVQFLQDCRRATTDAKVRIRRTEFLLNLL